MMDTSSDVADLDWSTTGKLLIARGVAAAIAWSLMFMIAQAVPLQQLPIFFVKMMLSMIIGILPYHFILRGIRSVLGGIPVVALACNLLLLMVAFAVAIGDPLVFAFNRNFPHILGLANFKPFNLVTALLVHQ